MGKGAVDSVGKAMVFSGILYLLSSGCVRAMVGNIASSYCTIGALEYEFAVLH